MPLGTKVGLSPGHNVLHGDPALPPSKPAQPHPIFGQCLLWSNGHPSQLLLSTCHTAHGRECLYFTVFVNNAQLKKINAVISAIKKINVLQP